MRQWLGETDASSRQIEFEEFRPMDRDPATGKSDFLSGPLSAASLGCTAKGLATDFLPGKPSGWESRILTPTLDRRHWKKSLRKDSATIRMVRFIPERLVGPPCHREKRPYLFSFPLIAGAFDSEKTRRNDTRREKQRCRGSLFLIRRIVADSKSSEAISQLSRPRGLASRFHPTSSFLIVKKAAACVGLAWGLHSF